MVAKLLWICAVLLETFKIYACWSFGSWLHWSIWVFISCWWTQPAACGGFVYYELQVSGVLTIDYVLLLELLLHVFGDVWTKLTGWMGPWESSCLPRKEIRTNLCWKRKFPKFYSMRPAECCASPRFPCLPLIYFKSFWGCCHWQCPCVIYIYIYI
jgi:hypothetical protein